MNNKIAVLTDSSSGWSQSDAQKLGVYLFPMIIIDEVLNKSYLDGGVEIETESVLKKMIEERKFFKTSLTPAEHMKKTLNKILETHDHIIANLLASGLSSQVTVFSNVVKNNPLFAEKVTIINTNGISDILKNQVMNILDLIKQGKKPSQIKKIIESRATDSFAIIIPENLTHLHKGGRVSGLMNIFGNVLRVKPILLWRKNKLLSDGKAITFVRGYVTEIEKLIAKYKINIKQKIWTIVHGNSSQHLINSIKEKLYQRFKITIKSVSLSPNIVSVHTGPGAIGLLAF